MTRIDRKSISPFIQSWRFEMISLADVVLPWKFIQKLDFIVLTCSPFSVPA
jgi:hypothetical protein